MISKQKLTWFYALCGLFIAANTYFLYHEFYWLNLLPLALLLVGFALFSLDKLLLIIVFLTPLSVNLEKLEFGLGVALPTEPLMFGAMLIFLIKNFFERSYDNRILKHPISIAIIINLIWISIACITSELPMVSIKYLVSRLWFVVCFYFLAVELFRNKKNMKRFVWLYIIPLTGIIIYTVARHASFGFAEQPAHWVMQPFFKDHTSYGAILAMFFPFIAVQLLAGKYEFNTKVLISFVLVVFIMGVIFSYTRATWASLGGALALALVILLRIRWTYVATVLGIVVAFLMFNWTAIVLDMERNKEESSDDLVEHVQSISNIASDASNLERLNRWNCAWKMFKERPIFGWGPGTYSFLYAPFQESGDQTIISTNFGNKGNAHSEYLGPMSEAGLLGMLTFLVIVGLVIYRAVMLYYRMEDADLKLLLLCVFLGLVTYYAHGLLNNYLDLDKASVPFWGFTAIIVAMDIYHRGTDKKSVE